MDPWLMGDDVLAKEMTEIEANSETTSTAEGSLSDRTNGDDVETSHQHENIAQDEEWEDSHCPWCNNDICFCEPCEFCDNYPAGCQCDWCEGCEKRTLQCFCRYCRECGGRGSLCVCSCCQVCDRYRSVCACIECRHCHQLVRSGYGIPCRCAPCSLCRAELRDCRCAGKQTRRKEVKRGSRFFEVIASGEYDRKLLLGGDLDEKHIIAVRKFSSLFPSFRRNISWYFDDSDPTHWYKKLKKAVERSPFYLEAERWVNKVRFSWEPAVESTHINVTTAERVKKMVTVFASLPRDGRPNIAIDIEADNLGRHGTTCYMQIRDFVHGQTYLVDLYTLKDTAFVTTGGNGNTTLKDVLQDPSLIKLIFDCRQDSDALFWIFASRIRLAGVLDVQIIKMLSAKNQTGFRPSLTDTLTHIAYLTADEEEEWMASKNFEFWRNEKGYAVFMDRPLSAKLRAYAVNDVKYLRMLHDALIHQLSQRGRELAFE